MNRFSTYTFYVLMLAAVAAALTACGESEATEKNIKKNAAAPAGIPAILAQEGKLSATVRIPGELQAWQQVDLYAKVSSFVSRLYADVGSEVQAGQLLATLEAPELNAQQNAAASRLKSQEAVYIASKATYERLLQTSKTPGTISPNDLELANARQQSDLAQLEAARATYREVTDTRNYLQIRAPFSGIIAARNVSTGAYVGPTGKGSELPMFTLVEQKKLRLVVSVPESYTGSLDKNGDVKFTVQSLPGDTFTARISRAAGALDNRLRSQRVEMDVANSAKNLLPGMVAEIVLPLQSSAATVNVPSTAILNSTLGVFVIRVKDGKAEWVPVATGTSNGERTEITGTVTTQDTLIKKASEEIRKGQTVQIQLEH